MSRNLYILAATLALFGLLCIGLAAGHVVHSAGDQSLWRTMGLGLIVVSLLIALSGVMSSLFEQAERRAEEQRKRKRRS